MKNLQDLSNEELWQLFPVIITDYDPCWTEWYIEEKTGLQRLLGESIVRMFHIGSTSVPGLAAKPIVDILLEIAAETDLAAMQTAFLSNGYFVNVPAHAPMPHMSFIKGYTPQGFAEKVYHVHIRYPGDWDELYFRDYLRQDSEACRQYAALKKELQIRFRHDRDAYTEHKSVFVKRYTQAGRTMFAGRYKDNGKAD